MNPPSGLSSNPGMARPAPAQRGGEPRIARAADRRGGDDFERLLRDKSKRRDDDTPAAAQPPTGDAPAAAVPQAPAPLPGLVAVLREAAPACGRVDGEASATAAKAGLGAALDTPTPGSALAGLRAETQGTWQFSVSDPRGLALELQLRRDAAAAPGAAPLALSIGSGVHDAALLARHTPRLNERLLARAVTATHVRIEEHEPHPEQR